MTTKKKPTKTIQKPKRGVAKRGKQLSVKQREELKDKIRTLHVLGGVSLRDIERQTGYNHQTVLRYWKDVKADLATDFEEMFGGSDVVNRALLRKEQRVRQLTQLSIKAESPSDKVRAMQAANSTDDSIIGILQDIGVVARNLGTLDTSVRTVKVFEIDGLEYKK